MSKIITPTDTILITIDNRVNPARADMKLSRDLPAPYVVMILAGLILQTMENVLRGLGNIKRPPTEPPADPSADPSGQKPNGN